MFKYPEVLHVVLYTLFTLVIIGLPFLSIKTIPFLSNAFADSIF